MTSSARGEEVIARPVANDQAAIEALIAAASENGAVALVIDQPASGAQLLLHAAQAAGVPVAYVHRRGYRST